MKLAYKGDENGAAPGSTEEMGRSMSDILKAANQPNMTTLVDTRPKNIERQRMPSNWNAASWLRSLTYEDMMQAATEMNALREEEIVDSPEKIAKLLHAWSKAVTDAAEQ